MEYQNWWKTLLPSRSSSRSTWIQRSRTHQPDLSTTRKLRSSERSTQGRRAPRTHQCPTTTPGTTSQPHHRQRPRQRAREVSPLATWPPLTRYCTMVGWCQDDLTIRRRNWSQAICPPRVTTMPLPATQNMTQMKTVLANRGNKFVRHIHLQVCPFNKLTILPSLYFQSSN